MEPKQVTSKADSDGGSGETNSRFPPPIQRGTPLEEILRYSCSASANRHVAVDKKDAFPSPGLPLAPRRAEYSDVKFSPQFNRTLMVGTDLMDPVDIFGIEICKRICEALRGSYIEKLNSLQSAAWPHILRGRDCAIIGGNSLIPFNSIFSSNLFRIFIILRSNS